MADVETLSEKAQILFDHAELAWVFDEVGTRILNGQLAEIEEAAELLLAQLEEHADGVVDEDDNQDFAEPYETDDVEEPREDPNADVDHFRDLDHDDPRDSDDADVELDELSEELAEFLWVQARETAEEWADAATDADALLEAFETLGAHGIEHDLFGDGSFDSGDRGAVLVAEDAWRGLSHEEERPLVISFTAHGDASAGEVGSDLVAALRDVGLKPSEPAGGAVTVPVLWRWHVDDPADLG